MRATVLLCAVATVVGNANFYANSSWFMQKIRNDVMDREYFSAKAPPTSDREANADERYGGYYADSGTDVKMQVPRRASEQWCTATLSSTHSRE